ncbi:MAG: hypothetical protein ABI147_00190 [Acidobacteriaceae bacterium]
MLALLPLITLIVNVSMTALQAAGITNASTSGLITSLESTVLPLISNLSSGQSKTADVLAVLGGLSGVIATLKTQTGLDPAILAQVKTLDEAVQAGLAAYVQAGKGVDLSVLVPIAAVA